MSTAAAVVPFAPKTQETRAIMERFDRGYNTSRAIAAFSETVKLGGMFLAGVLWVCAVVAYQAIADERTGFPVVSACFVAAATWIVLASRAISCILLAQSQRLEVEIDSAVAVSPFLSNPQRVELMILRHPCGPVGWQCEAVREQALAEEYHRLIGA